ncbi:hypothetical protein Adt_39433 [Abeliophyllum distichum]|uniref:Uncharacterized protein n=1 Tax=Abeliophyllum distichum TaxID=126358 RepID=A0ABD1Q529_9LAMI
MAVTSPDRRGKEGFPATCIIGTRIQIKYFVKEEAKNHCLNDQVCPHKCLSRTSNLRGALDAVEDIEPNSLSEKFLNGTSTIDIDVDDRHFDDSDSGDEAESNLPKVSTAFFE